MYSALIITVDHRSPELTARMLASFRRTSAFNDLALLVVRNGSDSCVYNGEYSTRKTDENIWVLECALNLGYFGSAKRGLQWYQEAQNGLPEWIIVCNNDVRVEQTDFFERLIQLNSSGVGVVAPAVISTETGLNQNPFMVRRPGRWRIGELRFWLRSYYLARFHEKLSEWKKAAMVLQQKLLRSSLDTVTLKPMVIYAPHGSFLIFNKLFFERGGSLDDKAFLFHEEISLAEMCRRIGLPVVYHPELEILHDEHSTRGRPFTRTIYQYQRQSLEYLTEDYLADLV